MSRGLWVIALAMLIGGANCARETVSCPEGTAIVDFENGGRECVPVGPDGGLGGTGGMGKPECEDDLDCPFEEASRCDPTSRTCEPCLEDVDCAGIDGLPRCDAAEGLCVQCAPATEAMDCGEQSCDPATRECSDIVRGSRAECEACVSDSDCMEDVHVRADAVWKRAASRGLLSPDDRAQDSARNRLRFRSQTHARACRARRPRSTAE